MFSFLLPARWSLLVVSICYIVSFLIFFTRPGGSAFIGVLFEPVISSFNLYQSLNFLLFTLFLWRSLWAFFTGLIISLLVICSYGRAWPLNYVFMLATQILLHYGKTLFLCIFLVLTGQTFILVFVCNYVLLDMLDQSAMYIWYLFCSSCIIGKLIFYILSYIFSRGVLMAICFVGLCRVISLIFI